MATISDTSITAGSARDLLKASRVMQYESVDHSRYLGTLKKLGIINYHEDLTKGAGSTLEVYNTPRLSSMGFTGDESAYDNAQSPNSGSRQVAINKHAASLRYPLKGTLRQQISEFNLKERARPIATKWGREFMLYQVLFQASSNTATTKYAPGVYDDAITSAAEKKIITGHNDAIAPSSTYKAIGSGGVGGTITADENVTSTNCPLTFRDFMEAREVICTTTASIPRWNLLDGQQVGGRHIKGLVVLGVTGMNQLKNDPVTQGQGYSMAQFVYASIAGGKAPPLVSDIWVAEELGFLEVPDDFLSRGINSSTGAPVANTRRAVILGADAIDFALGQGFGNVPGFSVRVDEEYKKLDDQGYLKVETMTGAKKAQITGTGANASTAYDLAVYTITHSSRT